jgi:hypothetical protein
MDRPSLKKAVIGGLANNLSTKSLKDSQLIVLTAFGMISGSPIFEDSNNLITSDIVEVQRKRYFEEYGCDDLAPGNDGYISMKDVEIISGHTTTYLAELVVFYDQIIGVCIGNVDS